MVTRCEDSSKASGRRRCCCQRSGRPRVRRDAARAELIGPRLRPHHRRAAGEPHRRRAPRRGGQRPDARAAAAHAPGRRRSPSASLTNCASAPPSTGTGSSCPRTWTACRACRSTASRPGTTFTYRFKVNQSGTYWYHSHSRFQEQIGLYGPHRRRAARRRAPRRRPRAHAAAVRLDRITIRNTSTPRSSARATTTTSANAPRRISCDDVRAAGLLGHARRAAHVRRDAHGPPPISPTSAASAYTYLLNGDARRPVTGPGRSSPASACACASSTARR